MRRLPGRTSLPTSVSNRLVNETNTILAIADVEQRKVAAEKAYSDARRLAWFRPVVEGLRQMSGPGERCMCCSGSESAEVEHYKDKATYPELAMVWENYLWLCGICNRAKGKQFNEACPPIDPLQEYVWDFFFIDEFGNLCARWDPTVNALNARAEETMRIYKLDRQALQESRGARLKQLKDVITDSATLLASGVLTVWDIEIRLLEWHASPLQPDVADYFIAGPGSSDQPFAQLLSAVGL